MILYFNNLQAVNVPGVVSTPLASIYKKKRQKNLTNGNNKQKLTQ
jgi:hypothetical protein